MQETRRLRLQSVIQEELSQVVPQEVKDPRVPNVTFTSVEVTSDGGQATVYVAILGAMMDAKSAENSYGSKQMKDCLQGLSSASGFLRRHLAKILTVRHIPTLIFKEDRGFMNTIRVQELLREIEKDPLRAEASSSKSDSVNPSDNASSTEIGNKTGTASEGPSGDSK